MASSSSPRMDCIIIGGGITGVCTAYQLLRHPSYDADRMSVTLVERCDIAAGASGKAGGFLARDWHGPATGSLAQLSCDLYESLAAELDGATRFGYRHMHTVGVRSKYRGATAKPCAENNPALAFSALRRTPGETGRKSGTDDWLDRIDGRPSIMSDTSTTAQVEPYLFTVAIFEAACKLGLRYIVGRPIELDRDDTGTPHTISVHRFSTGINPEVQTLPCTTVVLAAGPWTGRVARELDLPNASSLHIGSLPGYSVLLRPKEEVPATAVFAGISGNGAFTPSPELFPRPSAPGSDEKGLVYIAGENPQLPLPESAADVEAMVEPVRAAKLIEAAKKLSSLFEGAELERQALCFRPTTPTGAPVVGKLCDGGFVAAGAGPWGITLGPGTGQVVAELILTGHATSADISDPEP